MVGFLIFWLLLWLLFMPSIIIGGLGLDGLALLLVLMTCLLVGLGVPAWFALEAFFPTLARARTSRFFAGLIESVGLLIGLGAGVFFVVGFFSLGIVFLGVLHIGLPAWGIANLLGLEGVEPMNWIYGGVIGAAVLTIIGFIALARSNRDKKKG